MRKLTVALLVCCLLVAVPLAAARSGAAGRGRGIVGSGGAHMHHHAPVHGAYWHLRAWPWLPIVPLVPYAYVPYAPAVPYAPVLPAEQGIYYAPTPDEVAIGEFLRLNPCPATGSTAGPCPGYLLAPIDPARPIAADRGLNLQWITEAEARLR